MIFQRMEYIMSFKNDCLFTLCDQNILDCNLFVTYSSIPLTMKEYSSLNNRFYMLFPFISVFHILCI